MTSTPATDAVSWINNSLSVNTHLNWQNVPYTNLAQVEAAANYIGIHTFRDDNSNLSILEKVASAGFKVDVIANASEAGMLNTLETADPGSIRAIEGPNEVNGQANAGQMQINLYNAVKGYAALSNVPIFNETVSGIADQSQLGNLSNYADYGNVHIYWGSGTPWYATDPAYTWTNWTNSAHVSVPGKPIVVTEMGVTTSGGSASTSEVNQAKDILNAIMDGAKTGISFMNIYELVDSRNSATDPEGNFGLYDWNWNAKPAATALHNFTSILTQDTGVAAGGSLDYSMTGVPSATQAGGQQLFQDHAGHFDIVTWTENTTAAETVTFATAHDVNVYDPMSGTTPIATYTNVTSVNVNVVDHPLIIQVSGADSGGSASVPSSPAGAPASTETQYIGTAANDTLTGPDGQSNYIRGYGANDSISGGSGFNDINGNKGDDTIVGHSQVGDWLLGGQGNDSITDTSASAHNLLHGNLGNDTLAAGAGGDTLRGGQGDDVIHGGTGNDWISGDLGNNTISSGSGNDTFHGSAGHDLVTGWHAGDHVLIDAGTTYTVTQSGSDVHVDLSNGGQMVLQGVTQSSLQSGWIFTV